MGVFNKKRDEILDFRDEVKFDNESRIQLVDGFIDIKGLKDDSVNTDNVVAQTPSPDFLSSLAGASTNNNNLETNNVGSNSSFGSFWDNVGSNNLPISNKDNSSLDIQSLKAKLEDLEFKLGVIVDKIDNIGEKMSNFERRVSS